MAKTNLKFLILLPLLSSLAGCSSNTSHSTKYGEFVKNSDLGYLYEVTYEDYDWNNVTNWLNSSKKNNARSGGFGCSSVHNGNFYGRSFDFCFTDMCEFLVRTNHENGHFASMGISIADCNANQKRVEDKQLDYDLLPFCMVDGINENGVVCNTNVVPAHDLLPLEGHDSYYTLGTNPKKESLFYQFLPRFILDNAKSASHAIELLKERNITAANKNGEQRDYIGVSHMGFELHCMIADRNDTYVVEMVDNALNVVHSGANIMTNYYLTCSSPSGCGLERYSTLFDNYKEGETLEGMKNLIHRVKYSQCYNPNWEKADELHCPMWPTEFTGSEIVDREGKTSTLTFYNAEQWFRENWEKAKPSLQNAYDTVKDIDDSKRASSTGGKVPWISTHAEVYDIDNRTLHLVTQEKEDASGNYVFKEFKLAK